MPSENYQTTQPSLADSSRQLLVKILTALNKLMLSKKFESNLFDLADVDNRIVVPHNLGAIPSIVQATIVAVGLDGNLGYPIGTEIGAESWANSGGQSGNVFTIAKDATNVYVLANNFQNTNPVASIVVFTGDDWNTPSDTGNFKLKVRAWL